MDQPTSQAIIAVAVTLAPLVTALGVVYNNMKANQRAERQREATLAVDAHVEKVRTAAVIAAQELTTVTAQHQHATDGKLHDIHVLVNDQLTQAIARAVAAETQNGVLMALLMEIDPDHPEVRALAAAGFPVRSEAPESGGE